jgi:hypothetical protein
MSVKTPMQLVRKDQPKEKYAIEFDCMLSDIVAARLVLRLPLKFTFMCVLLMAAALTCCCCSKVVPYRTVLNKELAPNELN